MANKPFLGVPGGDVRVETPNGVVRTFGDTTLENLKDASWVNGGIPGMAYGAFPREGETFYEPDSAVQPTMKPQVNE